MTKIVSVTALDAAFDEIASRADLLTLCVGTPVNHFEAVNPPSSGGKMIASAALTAGVGGGDFTTADGIVSGRRLIVGAQAQLIAAEAGTADHVALVDQTAGELTLMTELTEPVALTPGKIVALKSFSAEVAAPV